MGREPFSQDTTIPEEDIDYKQPLKLKVRAPGKEDPEQSTATRGSSVKPTLANN